MELYDLINSDELKVLYDTWIDNGSQVDLNFAHYYNDLDINKFKVIAESKNYLFNGDVIFSNNRYERYSHHGTDIYSYSSIDIDNTTNVNIQAVPDGSIIADLDDSVINLAENVVSVYPYIWYEVVNGIDVIFSIPNQANWNIESYINSDGELILNTDNE